MNDSDTTVTLVLFNSIPTLRLLRYLANMTTCEMVSGNAFTTATLTIDWLARATDTTDSTHSTTHSINCTHMLLQQHHQSSCLLIVSCISTSHCSEEERALTSTASTLAPSPSIQEATYASSTEAVFGGGFFAISSFRVGKGTESP
ncbi:unnamed protein product [Hydatigera taeniaeformis]|uniref:Secreted protein n=1 Tax=Hydatigena taeniaeformis TaxID=6205 RepID=A0A0R3WVF3_HYDTA|nr:unnamed protein product [Hydatigera taeniaeformis]